MKLGILGAGMIVREFLPWLTGPESPFKVEALCSTERSAGAAQALCDQYGVPRHTTSYDELLSWVDVVYIAVPNILHVKYTRAALEAGRHVIVEKPMAPTAALAEELAELARSKKLFLFEAVTTQYQDNYAKIREVLPKVGVPSRWCSVISASIPAGIMISAPARSGRPLTRPAPAVR